MQLPVFSFFFFNDPAPPEIYTLSLHAPLPIPVAAAQSGQIATLVLPADVSWSEGATIAPPRTPVPDRKSTRLNSSHSQISYAVFCLKKKKIAEHPRVYSRRVDVIGFDDLSGDA